MPKQTTKVDFEKFSYLMVYSSETLLGLGWLIAHEKSKFRFLRIESAKTIDILCIRGREAYYTKIDDKS